MERTIISNLYVKACVIDVVCGCSLVHMKVSNDYMALIILSSPSTGYELLLGISLGKLVAENNCVKHIDTS